MKSLFLTCISFYLLCTTVLAQAPNKLSYQGIARDASGSELSNQNISIRASFHDGSATGFVSYKETFNPTTNQFGLFTLSLGTGTVVTGAFTAIPFSSGVEYLQIEMDPNGGSNYTDMGTTQLLSVPYALYSQFTGDTSMWKKNGTTVYYTNGKVGVGTSVGGYQLSLAGNGLAISDDPVPSIHFAPDTLATKQGIIFQTSDQFLMGATGASTIFGMDLNAPSNSLKIDASGYLRTGNDLYDTSSSGGIILKSASGQCFRITVDEYGNLITTPIVCP